MPWSRLFSVFVICCALTIAGCSKSSTDAGLEKEDLDGDGIGNIYDPDIDGDGIPNGSDPDIDGDGIPNSSDPDIDGDGKPNGKDPDIDGDGTSNEIDNTPTGDTWGPGAQGQCPGDATGAYPNCACPSGSQYSAQTNDCVADDPAGIGVEDPGIRYCDQIQVYGLNDEQTTGSLIHLTWNLQSSKTGGDCVVKDDVTAALVRVRASAVGAKSTASEQLNPLTNPRARIRIPLACTGETVKVTYDFTAIAKLIKANPKAAGWIVTQRHRADPERCDSDGDGAPDWGGNIVYCPADSTDPDEIAPNCSCPEGENYNEETNECDQKPNECEEGAHEKCIEECRFDYVDCLRRCDSSYCSEQCGGLFKLCGHNCNERCPEEDPVSCVPESFGVATVPDPDVDNDGIPNDSDSDVDGDGVPNTSDKDIDGDGIWNKDDLDIDGDGQINSIDPDADGDGTPDAEDDTPGGPR